MVPRPDDPQESPLDELDWSPPGGGEDVDPDAGVATLDELDWSPPGGREEEPEPEEEGEEEFTADRREALEERLASTVGRTEAADVAPATREPTPPRPPARPERAAGAPEEEGEEFGLLEEAGRAFKRGTFGQSRELAGGLAQALAVAGREHIGDVQKMADHLGQTEPALDPMAELEAVGAKLTEVGEDYLSRPEVQRSESAEEPYTLRWMVASTTEVLPQLAGQIALGLASGGLGTGAQLLAFAAPVAIMEGGGAYLEEKERLIRKGVPEEEAEARASGTAMVTAVGSTWLERIPGARFLFNKIPGADKLFRNGLARRLASVATEHRAGRIAADAVTEAATEAAQEAWGDVVAYGESKDPEVFQEWADRYLQSATIGGAAGGIAGAGLEVATRRGPQEAEEITATRGETAPAEITGVEVRRPEDLDWTPPGAPGPAPEAATAPESAPEEAPEAEGAPPTPPEPAIEPEEAATVPEAPPEEVPGPTPEGAQPAPPPPEVAPVPEEAEVAPEPAAEPEEAEAAPTAPEPAPAPETGPVVEEDYRAPRRYPPPGQERTREEAFVRDIARRLKDPADTEAQETAAFEMASHVPEGALLIPLPDSRGEDRANARLAERIAEHVPGAESRSVLEGPRRQSSFARRRAGIRGLGPEEIPLRSRAGVEIESDRPVVFIDNVHTTGATAEAARQTLRPFGLPEDTETVVWAKAEEEPGLAPPEEVPYVPAVRTAAGRVFVERGRGAGGVQMYEQVDPGTMEPTGGRFARITETDLRRDAQEGFIHPDRGFLLPEEVAEVRREEEVEEGERPGFVQRARRKIASLIAPELRAEAEEDALTGLLNRASDERFVNDALEEQDLYPNTKLVRYRIDLDNFKALNDARGHLAGDTALQEVRQALEDALRPDDTLALARVGGDEFAVTIRIPDGMDATEIRDRIEDTVASRLRDAGLDEADGKRVGASVGYAEALDELTSYRELDALADQDAIQRKEERGISRPRDERAEDYDAAEEIQSQRGLPEEFRPPDPDELGVPPEDIGRGGPAKPPATSMPAPARAQADPTLDPFAFRPEELEGTGIPVGALSRSPTANATDVWELLSNLEDQELIARYQKYMRGFGETATPAEGLADQRAWRRVKPTGDVVVGTSRAGDNTIGRATQARERVELAEAALRQRGIDPSEHGSIRAVYGDVGQSDVYNPENKELLGRARQNIDAMETADLQEELRRVERLLPTEEGRRSGALNERWAIITAELENRGIDPDEMRVGERRRRYLVPRWLSREDRARHAVRVYSSVAEANRVAEAVEQLSLDFTTRSTTRVAGLPTVEERLEQIGRPEGPDVLHHGYVSPRGLQVGGTADLYRILAPFRSPLAEIHHTVYLSEDGTVLDHEMVTSGHVDRMIFHDTFPPHVALRAHELGAARVAFAHNHPSGDPKSSREDQTFYKQTADFLAMLDVELMGALVMDSGTFSWLEPDLSADQVSETLYELEGPGVALGSYPDWSAGGVAVKGPRTVARLIRGATDAPHLVAIYLNAKHQILAASPVAESAVDKLATWLPQRLREIGATRVVFAVPQDIAGAAVYESAVQSVNRQRTQLAQVTADPQEIAAASRVLDIIAVTADPLQPPRVESAYEVGILSLPNRELMPEEPRAHFIEVGEEGPPVYDHGQELPDGFRLPPGLFQDPRAWTRAWLRDQRDQGRRPIDDRFLFHITDQPILPDPEGNTIWFSIDPVARAGHVFLVDRAQLDPEALQQAEDADTRFLPYRGSVPDSAWIRLGKRDMRSEFRVTIDGVLAGARALDRGAGMGLPPELFVTRPGVERIVVPAIRTAEGRVFTGGVHFLAISAAQRAGAFGDTPPPSFGFTNGFITSRGRFVDREQAEEIAVEAEQAREREVGGLDEVRGLDSSRLVSHGRVPEREVTEFVSENPRPPDQVREESADFGFQEDLFGEGEEVGDAQEDLFGGAGPQGISGAENDARAIVSKLRKRVEMDAATQAELEAYGEALRVLRRADRISPSEMQARIRAIPEEKRHYLDPGTQDLDLGERGSTYGPGYPPLAFIPPEQRYLAVEGRRNAWRYPLEAWAGEEPTTADHPRHPGWLRRKEEWVKSVDLAISRGIADPLEFRGTRYDEFGRVDSWEELPDPVYHVTTDVASVLRSGLKSRDELHTKQVGSSGTGLGGGPDNTISLTPSLHVARRIEAGIRLLHQLLNRDVTPRDLWNRAAEGDPSLVDVEEGEIVQRLDPAAWRDGIRSYYRRAAGISKELDWILDDVKLSRWRDVILHRSAETALEEAGRELGLGHPVMEKLSESGIPGLTAQDLEALGWEPEGRETSMDPEEARVHDLPEDTKLYTEWTRPFFPEEIEDRQRRDFEFYRRFLQARQMAGGPQNPVFIGTSIWRLARRRRDDIAILKLEFPNRRWGKNSGDTQNDEWRVYTTEGARLSEMRGYRVFDPFIVRESPDEPGWGAEQIGRTVYDAVARGGGTVPTSVRLARELSREGKREAARISEIVDDIEDTLGVPIRTGRLRSLVRALGVYRVTPEDIRVRMANNMPTIAHEVGHHLQKLLFGAQSLTGSGVISQQELFQEGMTRIHEWSDELVPLAEGVSESNEVRIQEGWAEFWSMWLTNREVLPQVAPRALREIEDLIRTVHPDLWTSLNRWRHEYSRYANADPRARVASRIVRGEPKKEKKYRTAWQRIFDGVWDSLQPLQRMQEDLMDGKLPDNIDEIPRYLADLVKGAAGAADAFIKRAPLSWNTLAPRDDVLSLRAIIQPLGDNVWDFEEYAVARRAHFLLTEREIDQGWTQEDLERAIQLWEDEHPEYREAFDELQAYNTALLEFLLAAGVISQATFDAVKDANPIYVPLHKVVDEQLEGIERGTGGHPFSPIQRIGSSGRDIISPLETIIRNTHFYVRLAERAEILRKVWELQQAHGSGKWLRPIDPPSEPTKVQREEVLAWLRDQLGEVDPELEELPDAMADLLDEIMLVWRPGDYFGQANVGSTLIAGKRKWFELRPDIYEALYSVNRWARTAAVKILSFPAKTLRAGATLSLDFISRNPLRDNLTAFIQSEYGFIPGVDFARGIFHLLGRTDVYWRWKAAGGEYAALVDMDRSGVHRNIRQMVESGGVPNVVKHPLAALQALSATMELGTRIGEYINAVQAGDRGRGVVRRILAEINPEERGRMRERLRNPSRALARRGALAGREISTNFSTRGASDTVNILSMLSAFWNARLQGYRRMGRAFKEDPIGASLRAVVSTTLPSILLYMMNRDEPEYWEIPQWQRDLFWLVKIPNPLAKLAPELLQVAEEDTLLRQVFSPFIEEDESVWLRIPKGFEIGQVFGTLPERMLEWWDTEDPEGLSQAFQDTFIRELLGTFLPLPTFAVPLIENFADYSTFLQRPIDGKWLEDVDPEHRAKTYTSETAKLMADWFARVRDATPGEDSEIIDKLIASPNDIDNILYGWGGTLGRQAIELADEVGRYTGAFPQEEREAPALADVPGLGGLIARDPGFSSESVERFYRRLQRLRGIKATWDLVNREEREEEIRDMEDDEAVQDALNLVDDYEDTADRLAQLRADASHIERDPVLSDVEKREEIEDLGKTAIEIAQERLERRPPVDRPFPWTLTPPFMREQGGRR